MHLFTHTHSVFFSFRLVVFFSSFCPKNWFVPRPKWSNFNYHRINCSITALLVISEFANLLKPLQTESRTTARCKERRQSSLYLICAAVLCCAWCAEEKSMFVCSPRCTAGFHAKSREMSVCVVLCVRWEFRARHHKHIYTELSVRRSVVSCCVMVCMHLWMGGKSCRPSVYRHATQRIVIHSEPRWIEWTTLAIAHPLCIVPRSSQAIAKL